MKKYTIILSERVKGKHGEILMFGETNDITQLQKEKQMLSIFAMFSNANTISYDIKKTAKENGIDFDNMTKKELEILQDIIDEEIEKRM